MDGRKALAVEKERRRTKTRGGTSGLGEVVRSVARKEGMKLLGDRWFEGRIECAEGSDSRAGIA
jgi:hypothetical protein